MSQDQAELEAGLDAAADYERLSHYGGEVELEYSHSLHAYTIVEDGARYLVPGTTTVVGMIDKSGPLTQWSANMTVEWVIANFPDAERRRALRNHYESFRDKCPWDESEERTSGRMGCSSYSLAKLLNEARFNYRTISRDATDIGHMAHEWLEGYIKNIVSKGASSNLPLPDSEKAQNCITAALKWFNLHKFRPIFAEKKLYSRRYGYAGTCDWLAYVTSCGDPECCPFQGEALVLGDFKSSRHLYDEYFCQLASYRQAIEEEFPDLVIGACTLLRLGKEDGEFEVRTATQEQFETDFDGFLGCLSMYFWQKQRDLNKRFDKASAKAEAKAAKDIAEAEAKADKAAVKVAKLAAKIEQEEIKRLAKAAKEAARLAAGKAPRKVPNRAVVREVVGSIPIAATGEVRGPASASIPIEGEAA